MMKSIILALALSALAIPAPTPTDLAGSWKFEFLWENRDPYLDAMNPSICRMKQDGKKLTGDCGTDQAGLMGEVNGRHVMVRVESGAKTTLTGELSKDGKTITGTWRDMARFGRFTATRQ